MTYALTLVKGISSKREETLNQLNQLKNSPDFKRKTGIDIREVFISFGWPDIILLMKGNNVELLKSAIVELRSYLENNHTDIIETSTIICTTTEEIIKKKKSRKKNQEKKSEVIPQS
jgi:hypothetical protein